MSTFCFFQRAEVPEAGTMYWSYYVVIAGIYD
jgi:hypothetical protein